MAARLTVFTRLLKLTPCNNLIYKWDSDSSFASQQDYKWDGGSHFAGQLWGNLIDGKVRGICPESGKMITKSALIKKGKYIK